MEQLLPQAAVRAEFKPKEPGWWRTGRRETRAWTLAHQTRAKRLSKYHRAGWWKRIEPQLRAAIDRLSQT